jgi:predicted ABC-type ATPase
LLRIKERVLRGGHNVPEADVRRRFNRSIKNFMQSYRHLAHSWLIFDNSIAPPSIIALEKEGSLSIMKPDIYRALTAILGEHG